MNQGSFNFSEQKSQNQSPISVSELNTQIKKMLEGEFHLVWLKGEISNFKAHSSGHYYFSLKDENSQISAVMFRGFNSRLKFRPKDGDEVVVRGKISVYPPRGSYQILCEKMDPLGRGGLQEAFEKLKVKLKQEGLFDLSNKKPLPYLPFRIALVTSPTGAAVRDMIQVLQRKHPAAQLIVVPTLTQGDQAPLRIIEALTKAEELSPDVIIVGRGGGSLEDLWCFNDEKLARHIFAMDLPVVSAVGHEIDFTISDFVADLRAPTPSAAAELVCKNVDEIKERLHQSSGRLVRAAKQVSSEKRNLLRYLKNRIIDPRKRSADLRLKLDDLVERMDRAWLFKCKSLSDKILHLSRRLKAFKGFTSRHRLMIGNLEKSLSRSIENFVAKRAKSKEALDLRLRALSPFAVLSRGYAIVTDKKSKTVLFNTNEVEIGTDLLIQLHEGKLETQVKKKEV